MDELPCQSSGAESQDAFHRALTAVLVGLAREAGLRPAEAADVSQTVWLKFCEKFPDFAGNEVHAYHLAWLLAVVPHEIVNAFRARQRHPACSLDALDEERLVQREQDSANSKSDERRRMLLHRWLEELSQSDPRTHELVCGRHLEGLSIAELAERTGRDAHWISDHIHRALKRFRAWLSKGGGENAASP